MQIMQRRFSFAQESSIENRICAPEYSPLGVLIGIQPWNYPYYQLSRFAAPHLMAGNVLLVKHASGVPQCALAFEQLFTDAGSPAGAYTNLFLSNDQVGALIRRPAHSRHRAHWIGTSGRITRVARCKNLKKSTMELGGSDCFIVLEDSDLKYAVQMAVAGRMSNAGQTASARSASLSLERVPSSSSMRFVMLSNNSSRATRWMKRPRWRHCPLTPR